MIVSHKHKFIFIKNRKVAGSTIEKALASVCGPNDIITRDPNQPPIARNFNGVYTPWAELAYTRSPIQIARTLRDWKSQRPTYYTHIAAYEARARIGTQVWNKYFKFCFERNPWDKYVSFYFWYYRNYTSPPMSFADFVRQRKVISDRVVPSDWRRYAIGKSVQAQFVGRFENLENDFISVCRRIGITTELKAKEKTNTRPAGCREYRRLYDSKSKGIVAKRFRREIEMLGYEF